MNKFKMIKMLTKRKMKINKTLKNKKNYKKIYEKIKNQRNHKKKMKLNQIKYQIKKKN